MSSTKASKSSCLKYGIENQLSPYTATFFLSTNAALANWSAFSL